MARLVVLRYFGQDTRSFWFCVFRLRNLPKTYITIARCQIKLTDEEVLVADEREERRCGQKKVEVLKKKKKKNYERVLFLLMLLLPIANLQVCLGTFSCRTCQVE